MSRDLYSLRMAGEANFHKDVRSAVIVRRKVFVFLGYVYLNKGDFANSLENFNAFIRLDPENPEVA